MTEAEWLSCDDPRRMLVYLRDIASDRQLRLFACACCRLIWHLIGPAHREVVTVAEQYADGLVSAEDLQAAWEQGHSLIGKDGEMKSVPAELAASFAARKKHEGRSWWSMAAYAAESVRTAGGEEHRTIQVDYLREIIGLIPFRPIISRPGRLASPIIPLARAAYEERLLPSGHLDVLRLAVLSDVLDEAGCHESILSHLRSPGPHLPGCWALDCILSKKS